METGFFKKWEPFSFTDNCFKTFVDKLFIKRTQLTTVENEISFCHYHTLEKFPSKQTKLRKSLKGLLNSCKLQIVSKSQRKLSNVCFSKDHLPFNLVSGMVYKFMCGRCSSTYYGETDRHLKVSSGKHIGISPLTIKETKPSKESAICNHNFKLQ